MDDSGRLGDIAFTTEPKTCRRLTRGAFISGNRAAKFMQHLWEVNIRKSCKYETLEWQFISWSGTNDKRTVERYIGRPEQTIYSKGASTVRMNRNTGQIAQFEYSNIRKVSRKKGLLKILGYVDIKPEEQIIEEGTVRITKKTKNWIAVLHHEKMDYYTQQTTLKTVNPSKEVNEESDSSKDEMCVSSLLTENNNQGFLQGKGNGETVLEVAPNEEGRQKRERDDIDGTHTNQSSESKRTEADLPCSFTLLVPEPSQERVFEELIPEARAIMSATPIESEPDRAKISWNDASSVEGKWEASL